MSGSTNTDSEIHDKVRALCEQGYAFYDKGDFTTALRRFYEAWTVLPKPQSDCEESTWILTAIGDAYFKSGNYDAAIEALRSALHCPAGDSNPFIYLRLGQAHEALNQHEEAKTQFERCIQLGGDSLLKAEDEKYQRYLLTES